MAVPPFFRRPAIQVAAKVGGAVVALWLVSPRVLSLYLSNRSGLRISVSTVWLSGRNPVLHGVQVRTEDGSELVRARRIKLSSGSTVATVVDPAFTVLFGDSELKASTWDLDSASIQRAANWAPRVALDGEVSLALKVRGADTPVRTARFDASRLDALRGFAGASGLVRALTQDTLRIEMTALPSELQRAARRIVRERIADDFKRARRSAAGAVDDARAAARSVERALEGLPDLQNYRDMAQQTNSFLDRISQWLGGSKMEDFETQRQAERQQRAPPAGFRILDEGPA